MSGGAGAGGVGLRGSRCPARLDSRDRLASDSSRSWERTTVVPFQMMSQINGFCPGHGGTVARARALAPSTRRHVSGEPRDRVGKLF